MAKFLSGRQRNLSVGINSFTEDKTVLDVVGKVGIGTTNATSSLDVVGDVGIRAEGASNQFVIQHNNSLNSLDFTFI
jgi:hypothetical protein